MATFSNVNGNIWQRVNGKVGNVNGKISQWQWLDNVKKQSWNVIEIVYGGVDYNKPALGTAATYTHTRYKITYQCNVSKKKDLDTNTSVGYQLLKSKGKWNGSDWNYSGSGLYKEEQVLDYVQDFVFVPHDEDGKIIGNISSGTVTPSNTRAFDVRTVDVGLVIRSTKPFYRNDTKGGGVIRKVVSLTTGRNIQEKDKYLREIITVTANARNVGLN